MVVVAGGQCERVRPGPNLTGKNQSSPILACESFVPHSWTALRRWAGSG